MLLLIALASLPAQIAPTAPTFCAGYTPDASDSQIKWVGSYVSSEGLSDRVLGKMAQAACDKPDDPERQAELAKWRQLMVDGFGASPELTLDMLEARIDPDRIEKEKKPVCSALNDGVEESLKLKAEAKALGSMIGCNDPDNLIEWFVDEQNDVSAVMRTAQVELCWRPNMLPKFEVNDDGHVGRKSYYAITHAARCAIDAKRLDEKAFIAELEKDDRLNKTTRVQARMTFALVKAWSSKELAEFERYAKKDPDFKAVLFDEPEAAFAAWQKDYQAHKADYDKVIDLEHKAHAANIKTGQGCGPGLRAVMAKYLATQKIESADDPDASLRTPWGYRITRALAFCEHIEGNKVPAGYLHYAFSGKGYNYRGPRWAAWDAALKKIRSILESRPKFVTIPGSPSIMRLQGEEALTEPIDRNTGAFDARGQIQAIKAQGDDVTVSFKKVTWSENTYDCRDTNRVDRVDWATGKVYYQQNCKLTGSQKRSSQEHPITFPKAYAATLKAGQFLRFMALRTDGKPRPGVPTVAFKDTSQKKALSFLGQKIK